MFKHYSQHFSISGLFQVLEGKNEMCYVLDTQLNKVGSSSELIYFYKQQNIIRGNYDKQGVLLF